MLMKALGKGLYSNGRRRKYFDRSEAAWVALFDATKLYVSRNSDSLQIGNTWSCMTNPIRLA